MKVIFSVLLFLFSIVRGYAQMDKSAIQTRFVLHAEREKLHRNMYERTIRANLSSPLNEETEYRFQSAFYTVTQFLISDSIVYSGFDKVIQRYDSLEWETRRSFLEAVYALNPKGYTAAIENILAGERKVRRHRTLLRTEETTEAEQETITSEERDHQVSEKSSLQEEVKATIESKVGTDAGVTATIRALGQRVGRTAEAEGLAAGIERHLAAIRQRTATLAKPRTLLVFGRERGSLRNIYASGGRGFLHDMLEAAGGINVFADIAAESVQASSELILTRAPEVIIELRTADMSREQDRVPELKVWSALASVPAVRDRRVHLLTRKGLAVPGPGVADSTEEFANVLHPR